MPAHPGSPQPTYNQRIKFFIQFKPPATGEKCAASGTTDVPISGHTDGLSPGDPEAYPDVVVPESYCLKP